MKAMDTCVRSWDRAIVALLRHGSLTEASAAAGISRSTLWRYLHDPRFRERLTQAKALMSSEVRVRLSQQECAAVDLLVKIMNDLGQPMGRRLQVARYILDRTESREFELDRGDLERLELETADFEVSTEHSTKAEEPGLRLESQSTVEDSGDLAARKRRLDEILKNMSPERFEAMERALELKKAAQSAEAASGQKKESQADEALTNSSRVPGGPDPKRESPKPPLEAGAQTRPQSHDSDHSSWQNYVSDAQKGGHE